MPNIEIGLQMYTVRDECARDYPGTLREVARIGYRNIELAGTYGMSNEALRGVLDDCGLKAVSTHEGWNEVRNGLPAIIERCKALDTPYVICPGVPGTDSEDAAVWDDIARVFNKIGQTCRDEGLTFGYHNHAHEYVMVNGRYGLDYLMEKTDPALVKMEVDVGWTWYAGVDPVAYVREHGARVELIHAKDHDKIKRDQNWPVGDGALDWKGIFEACREAGTRYAIVEEDQTVAPALESVAKSFNNLKAMGLS